MIQTIAITIHVKNDPVNIFLFVEHIVRSIVSGGLK